MSEARVRAEVKINRNVARSNTTPHKGNTTPPHFLVCHGSPNHLPYPSSFFPISSFSSPQNRTIKSRHNINTTLFTHKILHAETSDRAVIGLADSGGGGGKGEVRHFVEGGAGGGKFGERGLRG